MLNAGHQLLALAQAEARTSERILTHHNRCSYKMPTHQNVCE